MTRSHAFVIVSGRMSDPTVPRALPTGVTRASLRPRGDELLELARAAAAGDPDAAGTLITELGGGILRTVRKVMGPRHPDLDDVAQEAALSVLGSLGQFRAEASVAHFANRVALLTALGARRKLRSTLRKAQDEALPLDGIQDPRSSSTPYGEALSRQRREIVLELLDDLSTPIAESLALHFMLGHSVEDIARALNLSEHTVWSRLRLGKQALRRKFRSNGGLRELLEGSE